MSILAVGPAICGLCPGSDKWVVWFVPAWQDYLRRQANGQAGLCEGHPFVKGQGNCELLRGLWQRCSLEQAGHLSKEGIQAIGNRVRPWCSTVVGPVTRQIAHYKLLVWYMIWQCLSRGWAAGQMLRLKGQFKIVTLPGITVANEAAA